MENKFIKLRAHRIQSPGTRWNRLTEGDLTSTYDVWFIFFYSIPLPLKTANSTAGFLLYGEVKRFQYLIQSKLKTVFTKTI